MYVSSHVLEVWKCVFVCWGRGAYILKYFYISWWRPEIVRYLLKYLTCSYLTFWNRFQWTWSSPIPLGYMALPLSSRHLPGLASSALALPVCAARLGSFCGCWGTKLRSCYWSSKQLPTNLLPRPLEIPYSKPITWFVSLPSSTENNSQNHHYGSSLWFSKLFIRCSHVENLD